MNETSGSLPDVPHNNTVVLYWCDDTMVLTTCLLTEVYTYFDNACRDNDKPHLALEL